MNSVIKLSYRKILICLLILIGVCGFSGYLLTAPGVVLFKDAAADAKPLRLHVLADSDSPYDQQIKLAVRDFAIDYLADDLRQANTKEQAMVALNADLAELEQACNDFVADKADYGVRLCLAREQFPQIDYDGLVLSEGEYDALRIILGEGAGHNWWCVLFPPLCFVDLAGEYQEEAVAAVAGMDTASNSDAVIIKWKFAQLWGE
ncbi:MAG: stage II sporulation protein R [Clostridiales bacterium]